MVALGAAGGAPLRVVKGGLPIVAALPVGADVGALRVSAPILGRVDANEVVDTVARPRGDDRAVAGGKCREEAEGEPRRDRKNAFFCAGGAEIRELDPPHHTLRLSALDNPHAVFIPKPS